MLYMRPSENLSLRRGLQLHLRYAQILLADTLHRLVNLERLCDRRLASRAGLHVADLHQRIRLQEAAQVSYSALSSTTAALWWNCEVV